MLSEWMMKLGLNLLDVLYTFLGVLPGFSDNVKNVVDQFFNLMFQSVNIVGIFIDLNMVRELIPLVIAIINADKIIKIVMFVLKKIPILDIK